MRPRLRTYAAASVSAVAAMVAMVAGPGTPSAGAQSAPTQVTVASGPGAESQFFVECSDVAAIYTASTSFVISRTGPTTDQLTVDYSTSGGEPGVDYEPLPGMAVIPAGASTVTVAVQVDDDVVVERSRLVTLALTIEAGDGYELGEPSTTTIMFERRRDPALGPLDCNPQFQLLDVPANTHQTIPIGSVPVPIAFTGAFAARADVVAGSLPPGVTIAEADFGRTTAFAGAATTVGTFAATVRVCPVAESFTCRTTVLTVSVVASGAPPGGQLPVTGGTGTGTSVFGALLLAVTATLLRRAVATAGPLASP